MVLPCELVDFKGERKTKEAANDEDKSCVLWKTKFDQVPKPSQKSYRLWNEFVDWLLSKRIETIVDFDLEVDTIYKMSSDKKYVKKKEGNEEVLLKATRIMYGQQIYEETNEDIENNWKMIIAEMKPNRAVIMHGTFHVRSED